MKVETKEKLWTGLITLMNKAGRAEDAYIQLQDAAVQGRTYINRDGLD